jgi:hypothetical protein
VRIAAALLLIWTLIYAVVCFRFISKNGIDISPQVPVLNNIYRKITPKFTASRITEAIDVPVPHEENSIKSVVGPLTNPFLSGTCEAMFKDNIASLRSVSVIIPSRNEDIADLTATISSVTLNSGSFLQEVVVVDDASIEQVSKASVDWDALRKKLAPATLVIHRSHKHVGVSGAKVCSTLLTSTFTSTYL